MPAAPFPAGMSRPGRQSSTLPSFSMTRCRRYPTLLSLKRHRPAPGCAQSDLLKHRLCRPTCWPLWSATWYPCRPTPPTAPRSVSGPPGARKTRQGLPSTHRSSCWGISTNISGFLTLCPSWTISPFPTLPPGPWRTGAASRTAKRRSWSTPRTPQQAPASGSRRWWPTRWPTCGSATW